ncbi:MAG: DNA/RNA non-specific endonuclease [Burkholderiaceae bacterium]|nr:DNA/RNA non-specific endonuclease [Burkholderiaceae bacterium]
MPKKSSPPSPLASLITASRRTTLWFIAASALSVQGVSCISKIDTPASPGPAQARSTHVATQFSGCREFFAAGVPPRLPPAALQRELCYASFAVLHNGHSKIPVFVAERLNRAVIEDADDEKRTNRFFADARLPSAERATLEDYAGSGYARGHMAPAADMPTATAMAQSFSLANMVPQAPRHNSGIWAKIERDTRHYAARAQGDVYVITGPVLAEPSKEIGPGRIKVPKYLFKLVYDARAGRAWAYWHENADSAVASPPISYDELVRRTGMELLPGIPAAASGRLAS